ncbi:MAG: glycosyl transferase, partial [Cytophagaceae bacterium]|nr:glycosyl transferase [Cytophagaceae bacterium]
MRFVIISHAPHIKNDSRLYAYSPYVKEMNMWLNHVDDVEIVAPKSNLKPTLIDESYEKNEIELTSIPEISLRSIYQILRAILLSPMIMYRIFIAMKKADHI